MHEHPNYESYTETKDCSSLEPENPYNEGSGHYAGFEWGESGKPVVATPVRSLRVAKTTKAKRKHLRIAKAASLKAPKTNLF